MDKLRLENSLSVGLIAGCILTYLPPLFSSQLWILTILYGLYIFYLMMINQKISVIHRLNIAYILCQWLVNGVQFGYSAVLVAFGMYTVMYFSSERYLSITRLFCVVPPPKISYTYVLLSCTILIIYSYLYPNTARQFELEFDPLRGLDLPTLIVVGATFALFNAFWEETVFRGFYYEGFKFYALLRWIMPQLVFSLLHYQNGFPRGSIGVFLTFIFGLMMQHIRIKSNSLVPCIIVHGICDAIIFALIVAAL